MNWARILLDGITMAVVFNAVALLGFLVVPQAYSTMFPKDIKKAAASYVEQKDVRIMKWILHPLYILLVLFWGISARLDGMTGFWSLFWAGYVEMTLVSVTDFIILDCVLPPRITHMIKGAENCKGWERKEWLTKLAIPEHGLVWTFVMCPLAGLCVAGIGLLPL